MHVYRAVRRVDPLERMSPPLFFWAPHESRVKLVRQLSNAGAHMMLAKSRQMGCDLVASALYRWRLWRVKRASPDSQALYCGLGVMHFCSYAKSRKIAG